MNRVVFKRILIGIIISLFSLAIILPISSYIYKSQPQPAQAKNGELTEVGGYYLIYDESDLCAFLNLIDNSDASKRESTAKCKLMNDITLNASYCKSGNYGNMIPIGNLYQNLFNAQRDFF